MNPARTSRRYFDETKLLVLERNDEVKHQYFGQLNEHLNPGDVLVFNRSATLPSSFSGRLERTQQVVELRLAAFQGPEIRQPQNWLAILFGEGDWRQPTEERSQPPPVVEGDLIFISEELRAEILEVRWNRLLRIKFQSQNLVRDLYNMGKPIQYSYHQEPLEVWDQQTIFSGPPISVEPPSASFQFSWKQLLELREKGVEVTTLLHGAGISSTGNSRLDQLLPLSEWYQVPLSTMRKIESVREIRKKVVAVGTTVLRALQSVYENQKLEGLTSLKIKPETQLAYANALLTGMHEPESSHMELLFSFSPREQILRGYQEANALSYRAHEYGDLALLISG
ncbi:MAG: S-adenosylmethionine:tRNA ribosyltransferase-isomerase [Bdellovibrionales bacterium]|nr:S-adenosylmethionine:tRNA ribosyltransferase-isomerase [Bdellovibrionales bacterium]